MAGASCPAGQRAATARRIGFRPPLVHKLDHNDNGGWVVRILLMVYLCGVIPLLAVSTTIEREE